eukprot:CCRYP_009832-RA/>CCRYP_009832-RA protein AED:0.21 eAED:0.41 QI:0/0/0/1/0/0/2/0/113
MSTGRDAQPHGRDNFRAGKNFPAFVWKLFSFTGMLNGINIWEHSSMYKPMIGGRHDELDFKFLVDGVVFHKLFCLVDVIYPQLTRFLLSEFDPHTKLAFGFAHDQESDRKDVE